MKALLQRTSDANIKINNKIIAEINYGVLVLVGLEKNDTKTTVDKLTHKILNFRMFADNDNKMNLNIKNIAGEILLVSQFTLVANTKSGNRAGFSAAMANKQAQVLYNYLVDNMKNNYTKIKTGLFATDMQITLTNDGPVTFLLEQI